MKNDDRECLHYTAAETKESYDLHLEFLELVKKFYNDKGDIRRFYMVVISLTYLLNTLMITFEIANRDEFLKELVELTNELYKEGIKANQSEIYQESLH